VTQTAEFGEKFRASHAGLYNDLDSDVRNTDTGKRRGKYSGK